MKLLLFILLQINLPIQELSNFLDSIQHEPAIKNAQVVAAIQNTKTKQTIFSFNAEKAVNSASTLKLITTGAALSILGANYQYQTYIEYDGTITDNQLNGNIYIRGTGDPSLGSVRVGADFKLVQSMFAQAILDAGIKKVNGFILGDGSIFTDKTVADSWIWGDMGNYYGAGVHGLNFNENLYEVAFKSGNNYGESTAVVEVNPKIEEWEIDNRVLTGEKNSGDQVTIYSSPLSNKIILAGSVPSGVSKFVVKGSMPDPAYLLAQGLKTELIKKGLDSSLLVMPFQEYKRKYNYYPKPRSVIFTYSSPQLKELAKHCNYQSINLYADAMLKTCGYALAKDADFDSSVMALKAYFGNQNIDLQGFMIRDGSGLSPSGVLTATNMTNILSAYSNASVFQDYYASIPILGISGTVKNLGKNTKAAGNVRAKSGSISNTRAFAGYYTAQNGDLMSFMVAINRYADGADAQIRKILEKFMVKMVEISN